MTQPGLPEGYDPYVRPNREAPPAVSDGNPVLVSRTASYGEGWGNRSNTVVGHQLLWCPGCRCMHAPQTRLPQTRPDFDGPLWEWDGNEVAPTFSPSLLVYSSVYLGRNTEPGNCHSFIRNGIWEFLGDCAHPLANLHVPMVPVPDWVCQHA